MGMQEAHPCVVLVGPQGMTPQIESVLTKVVVELVELTELYGYLQQVLRQVSTSCTSCIYSCGNP